MGLFFILKKKYIGARGFSITPLMLMKNTQEWKSKMDWKTIIYSSTKKGNLRKDAKTKKNHFVEGASAVCIL